MELHEFQRIDPEPFARPEDDAAGVAPVDAGQGGEIGHELRVDDDVLRGRAPCGHPVADELLDARVDVRAVEDQGAGRRGGRVQGVKAVARSQPAP